MEEQEQPIKNPLVAADFLPTATGRPITFNVDMENTITSTTPEPEPFQLDPEFIQKLREHFNRKKNAGKDSKQTRAEKLKIKKAARREANASRKINQARNRKNKFTRKK